MGDSSENVNEEDKKTTKCPSVNREYLLIKAFYFFFFSAQGAACPYLSLYFKQLHLRASQVGMITGIKPYIAFFLIPLWGAAADKFNKSKTIFVIAMVAFIITFIGYALAPAEPCASAEKLNNTKHFRSALSKDLHEQTKVQELLTQTTEPFLDMQWTVETPIYMEKDSDIPENKPLFMYLFLFSLIGTIFSCPSLTLADNASVQMLRENKETHKYGKQRLWGSLGQGIASFVVGASISRFKLCNTTKKNDTNYYPTFYVFALFMAIALLVGTRLKFSGFKRYSNASKKSGFHAGLKLVMKPRFFIFLVTTFLGGVSLGFIKTFLFWYLKDLGGPQMLFSIMLAINCFAEVSMYYFSVSLIKYFGHVRVFYLGLLCYAIRCFYYAALTNPWYVLPVELLSGITTAAVWAAMMSYVGINSVEGCTGTLQGVLHSVHWGLGVGSGDVIGGFLVGFMGAPGTFITFGVLSLVNLVIYILVETFSKQDDPEDEIRDKVNSNGGKEEDKTELEMEDPLEK